MYKGTIIENSLSNKGILGKVIIEKRYTSGDWVLYNVYLNENMIPELSESLDAGPWYIHLWKQGSGEVNVIFKNKIFKIQYSDKSTWINAIEYGKSIGIPEEQLDFPVSE